MPIFLFALILPPAVSAQLAPTPAQPMILQLTSPAAAPDLASRYQLFLQPVFPQSSDPQLSRLFRGSLDAQAQLAVAQDPAVVSLEADQNLAAAAVATNDTFFTADPNDENLQWYLAKTGITDAWDYSRSAADVTIAVVDTGIHASHVELNDGRVIAGYDILTGQPIPANSDSDDNGHGTAVAGVIGAIPNNDKGIAGIDWRIKIMPVKALSADGTGDTADVSNGIVWAADHGANIINLSLGGVGFGTNQTLLSAITYAYNKGSLIVAAAGNDQAVHGLNLDTSTVYPVCADNVFNMVLGVAATDIDDQKTSFSNYGSKCIDVSAPGKKIITAAYLPSDPSNNLLIYGSGTSLAAPIVSAIAALYKSYNPNLSNVEIRNIITQNADNIDSVNTNNCNNGPCAGLLGAGRVNAYNYFKPKPIGDGSLVKDPETGLIYLIQGSLKRTISEYVLIQRGYNLSTVITAAGNELSTYSLGDPVLPPGGTLVKSDDNPTVYVIDGNQRRPLSFLAFVSRDLNFADVKTLPASEVNSYPLGDWYLPADGALFTIQGQPLVYMMQAGTARPVTYFTFINRRLSFVKVYTISQQEFSRIPPPPDGFWLPPLDGTLIKSTTDPAVYLIQDGQKHLMSYEAFTGRHYSFAGVKSLPPVEFNLIAPGDPIINP